MPPKAPLVWTRQQLVSFLHQAIAESLDKSITPRYFAAKDPSRLIILQAEDGTLVGVKERRSIVQSENAAPATQEKKLGYHPPQQKSDGGPREREVAIFTAEANQSDDTKDAEIEKIVEELAASAPTLPATTQPTEPPFPQQTSPDESFLTAKLDFADPLAFKVRLSISPSSPALH